MKAIITLFQTTRKTNYARSAHYLKAIFTVALNCPQFLMAFFKVCIIIQSLVRTTFDYLPAFFTRFNQLKSFGHEFNDDWQWSYAIYQVQCSFFSDLIRFTSNT